MSKRSIRKTVGSKWWDGVNATNANNVCTGDRCLAKSIDNLKRLRCRMRLVGREPNTYLVRLIIGVINAIKGPDRAG
eukprot:1734454-Karenia_brevis.AAC.1